jgi:hypothetical protein
MDGLERGMFEFLKQGMYEISGWWRTGDILKQGMYETSGWWRTGDNLSAGTGKFKFITEIYEVEKSRRQRKRCVLYDSICFEHRSTNPAFPPSPTHHDKQRSNASDTIPHTTS